MTSSEFWQGLDFDAIATFSIFRGEHWHTHQKQLYQQYVELYEIYKTIDLVDTVARMKNRDERQALTFRVRSSYLVGSPPHIDGEGNLTHKFGQVIARLSSDSKEVDALGKILQTPFSNSMDWMCQPVFREGIIFYKNNKMVNSLDICLECSAVENNSVRLEADESIFSKLEQWFKELGHHIFSTTEEFNYVIQMREFSLKNR